MRRIRIVAPAFLRTRVMINLRRHMQRITHILEELRASITTTPLAAETEDELPEVQVIRPGKSIMTSLSKRRNTSVRGCFQMLPSQRFLRIFGKCVDLALRFITIAIYVFVCDVQKFCVGGAAEIHVRVTEVLWKSTDCGTRPRGKTSEEDAALAENC